jgi:hypothetical protein
MAQGRPKMPLLAYFWKVGAALLALLFVADFCPPKAPVAERKRVSIGRPQRSASYRASGRAAARRARPPQLSFAESIGAQNALWLTSRARGRPPANHSEKSVDLSGTMASGNDQSIQKPVVFSFEREATQISITCLGVPRVPNVGNTSPV